MEKFDNEAAKKILSLLVDSNKRFALKRRLAETTVGLDTDQLAYFNLKAFRKLKITQENLLRTKKELRLFSATLAKGCHVTF